MAKWGEGDPRWLVEERPDATNVNNWHWTEKNASAWSQDKLKELLVGLKIDDEKTGCVSITELSKCEGEASANNRKAKLIFFYEWELKMLWKGKYKDDTETIEGEINIPNLSDENDASEIDVRVKVTSGEDTHRMKEMILNFGAGVIQEALSVYIKNLKQEFSQGMILPNKNSTTDLLQSNLVSSQALAKTTHFDTTSQADTTKSMKNLDLGCKIQTSDLSETLTFKCTAEEFYNALTVKEMVQAFTQSSAVLDVRKGGRFELFGGSVSGEFLELEPHKNIVKTWRLRNWPAGHYSTVTLSVEQLEECTQIHIRQTNIPTRELESTQVGWNRYYWEAMRRTFGFGATLL